MNANPKNIVAGLSFLWVASFLSAHVPSSTPVTHQHLLFKEVELKTVLTDDIDGSEVRVSRKLVPPVAGTVPKPGVMTYIYTLERDTDFNHIYSLLTLGIQAIEWEVTIDAIKPPAGGKVEVGLVKGGSATVDLFIPGTTVPRTGKVWSAVNNRDIPVDDKIWLVKLAGAKSFTFTVTTVNRPKIGFTKWNNGSVSNGHDNTPPD